MKSVAETGWISRRNRPRVRRWMRDSSRRSHHSTVASGAVPGEKRPCSTTPETSRAARPRSTDSADKPSRAARPAGRDRAGDFHPALQDAPEGVVPDRCGRGIFRVPPRHRVLRVRRRYAICRARVGHGRGHAKVSQHRPGLREPLRGHVERFAVAQLRFGPRWPAALPSVPARMVATARLHPNRQQDDREQQVVKLVRVADVRPRLSLSPPRGLPGSRRRCPGPDPGPCAAAPPPGRVFPPAARRRGTRRDWR